MRVLKIGDITYLIKTITSPSFGEVDLGPASLLEKIMDETGSYISEEARLIDEQIFFYVPEAVMHHDDDLIKYLDDEVLI